MADPPSSTGSSAELRRSEVECLARAIYFEARGTPMQSREAIAHVVMNRMERRAMTACAVVGEKVGGRHQFSFNHARQPRSAQCWREAQEIATRFLTARPRDFTRGATSFYNHRLVRAVPEWARRNPETWRDHAHAFVRVPTPAPRMREVAEAPAERRR